MYTALLQLYVLYRKKGVSIRATSHVYIILQVGLPSVLREEEVPGEEGAPQDQEGQAGLGAGLQVPGEIETTVWI